MAYLPHLFRQRPDKNTRLKIRYTENKEFRKAFGLKKMSFKIFKKRYGKNI